MTAEKEHWMRQAIDLALNNVRSGEGESAHRERSESGDYEQRSNGARRSGGDSSSLPEARRLSA
jgi:hypothetical protein